MENILITGGAGFIGCNFVRLVLAETGARVVVLDKLTYAGSLESLADVLGHPRFDFVAGGHRRPRRRAPPVRRAPPHGGGQLRRREPRRPLDRRRQRLHPDQHRRRLRAAGGGPPPLATLAAAERDAFRFLHVSTDEVYGSLGADRRVLRDHPYAPNSPYAASKAAADHLVRAYHETYGLPALVTNCSNNYGPYQFPEKLIPLMVLNALDGRPLPIYGDGGNVRDWIYVEDHCRGVLAALDAGGRGRSTTSGGAASAPTSDRRHPLRPARERAAGGRQPRPPRARLASYAALKTFVADRPGTTAATPSTTTRSARELGWAPRKSFEEGLRATVRWYLARRDWCAAVQGGGYGRERLGLGREPETPENEVQAG